MRAILRDKKSGVILLALVFLDMASTWILLEMGGFLEGNPFLVSTGLFGGAMLKTLVSTILVIVLILKQLKVPATVVIVSFVITFLFIPPKTLSAR